jgi:hypothetical protein
MAKETRIRLVHVKGGSQTLTNKMFDEAVVIIWACGYSTNLTTILDEEGHQFKLKMSKGQCDVNENANIL